LTVPGLLLLIIAVSLKGGLSVHQMALVVASLAWLHPTRTIRAQVLSLRERGDVEVARLSGLSGAEIIVKKLLPNLLLYLAATLVTVLFHAIRENDHFLIQGVVFSVIVALGLATLVLDVLYPWLDPRIT
jgi:peptide/nickel transport system permease protein